MAALPILVLLASATLQSQPLRIGITQNDVGVDSYQTAYEQAFIDAVNRNADVDAVVLDAGGDPGRQIDQVQELIRLQVDVIIIWPTDGRAVFPVVRQAYGAGIPVVVTNSQISRAGWDFIASFSGPDNITQGAFAAEMMCEGLNGEGRVVQITGQPGYTTTAERAQGFEERFAEICPDASIIETQTGNWNRERAQSVMESYLIKYNRIDGVYAADDNMGVGALNAATDAGRQHEMIFVGATNFAVGYEAMQRGEYYGSVYQSPIEDAESALQTATNVANGVNVPFLNYFETPKITLHNLDDFEKPVF